MIVEELFTWLAAASAFYAAWLWYKASVVEMPAQETPGRDGLVPASYTVDGVDVGQTAKAQSKLNANAAVAAGISACFHGMSLLAGLLL